MKSNSILFGTPLLKAQKMTSYPENLGGAMAKTVAMKSSLWGFTFGFTFVSGGLDIENLIKSSMIYSVSHFDLGGLGTLFGGGLSPPEPPVATGLAMAPLSPLATPMHIRNSRLRIIYCS